MEGIYVLSKKWEIWLKIQKYFEISIQDLFNFFGHFFIPFGFGGNGGAIASVSNGEAVDDEIDKFCWFSHVGLLPEFNAASFLGGLGGAVASVITSLVNKFKRGGNFGGSSLKKENCFY